MEGAILVAVIISLSNSCANGIFTTSKCSDSMVETRIIANCRRRGLVNIFDLHLDDATSVLDLTDNEFGRLTQNQFFTERLVNLEEIILRRNLITAIDSQAFNGLSMLHVVDLSQNRISAFSLAYMPPLRTLNMSQNPLTMEFSIYSATLEVLDISSCNLLVVPIRHYSELPLLQHLNFSNNMIDTISLPTLQHMHLRSIQFHGNPIRCSEETHKLLNWFERQRIQFSPICQRHPTTYLSPAAPPSSRNTHVYTQPQNLPTNIRLPSEPSHDECLAELNSLRNEHRLIAFISLAIHLVIVVLVLVFFGLYLSDRFKDRKKPIPETVGIEEEAEMAPPPYRYRSGFRI